MELILGIDAGGSKTTALLADKSGTILGRGTAGACAFQALPEDVVRSALRAAATSAFESAGLTPEPAAILGLGISGVDRPGDHEKVQCFLKEENLAGRNIVVNDSELLLWCGGLQGWGIGVISGTGSIVFGRSQAGRAARSGGWGYRFGDEGSGFAIGTAALRAMARADDGRGPHTLLTRLVLEHWGLEKTSDLIPHIYQGRLPYPHIARLAVLVQTAAGQGDAAALQILDEAASELAEAVKAVCRQLGFQGMVPAALGGGVLLNIEMIRSSMILGVSQQGVYMEPLVLAAEPVQGAIRMALNGLKL